MELNQQVAQSLVNNKQVGVSNVFSKSVHSRLYQSFHLQNSSTLTQGRQYDAQYRYGFPKLYSFDTSVQGKSRVSLDQKSKYSFRNDYTRIVEENSALIQENLWLKQELNRLNVLLQNERLSMISRQQYERVLVILQEREREISTLRQRIIVLERAGGQTNQWQIRWNQSQTIITQLNTRITTMTQQLTQYESRFAAMTQQLAQYQSQISQLNIRISTFQQQITEYKSQISQYQSRITILEEKSSNPAQPVKPQADPQLDLLRGQIQVLTERIQQYQIQISQYQKTFAQYETQITTLQQVNWKLQQRIKTVTEERIRTQDKPQPPAAQPAIDDQRLIIETGKLNLRIIILLEEINRLRLKEQQLTTKSQELHAYLLKAQNYIEQIQSQLDKNNLKENIPAHIVEKITLLEQENVKYTLLIEELQSRLQVTQIDGVSYEEHYAKLGERDFRIIILLEEINRLNTKVVEVRDYLQKAEDYIEQLQYTIQHRQTIIPPEIESQITYMTEENHRLNGLIAQYIEEIKHLKVNVASVTNVKIEHKIPAQVQARLALLAQENERLNREILQWQSRPARVQTITEYRTSPQIQQRLLILTQQNSKLTHIITQLKTHTTTTITSSNEQLQKYTAKLQMQSIILLQEINRLNHSLREVSGYLINAENFIEQLEIRLQESHTSEVRTQVRTEYVVPEEIEKELAQLYLKSIFLLEEINRLNHVIREVHGHLVQAENYIEQCEIKIHEITSQQTTTHQVVTEYRITPQVESRLAFLTQENDRLTKLILEIQSKPARVQTKVQQKIEFKIPPEFETRLGLLVQENERLKLQLSSTSQSPDLTLEYAKLTLKSIFLLQEINRLNHATEELRGHLINAENYIYEFEQSKQQNQPQAIVQEYETEIANLRQENQKLHAEINRISLSFEQQITVYKTEIANINVQLSTFRTEATQWKSKATELERKSQATIVAQPIPNEFELKWAEERFRAIILLEEINRLNQKIAAIDAERVEVIGHLVNAENFIQELEVKYAELETATKVSTVSNQVTVVGSNQAIEELNYQLVEIEKSSRVEIAARDLRIIFLLEEINRLNHKERSLLSKQSTSIASADIQSLLRQNQDVKQELSEVLSHLRQAEDYIGQLMRENEGFAQERDQLIGEINQLRFR